MKKQKKYEKYGVSGVSQEAWDACCDGNWLANAFDIPEGVDPWDGQHDNLAREIEQEAEKNVRENELSDR